MRTSFYRDFLTGLTGLVGLAGLIVMLVLFGEMTDFGKRTYTLTAVVANAGGLRSGSPVTFSGVRVGEITEVSIRTGGERGATIVFRVREDIRLPRSVTASINQSFVGESSLELVLSEGGDPLAFFAPGEVFDAGNPKTPLASLADLAAEPIAKMSSVAQSVEGLAKEYAKLGERLNDLVEARTLADVQAGKAPNIRSTLERLDRALVSADQWLGDEGLQAQARSLLDRAGRAIDDAASMTRAWEKAAGNVDLRLGEVSTKVDAVAGQAVTVLASADKAAGELASLLERVSKGEGTAGQLVTNPDLYNALRDASVRVDRALAEFELLLEKLRNEGLRLGL
ncbi:MAG: MCE family protein [Phycisphaerales bacterium]|nr:MCE family protein [Phycisphaerales bacterium]